MEHNSHKVILTNRSVGITVSTVVLSGHSGKRYGHSRYSDHYRCHVVEMTIEEYEVASDDLSRAWHKALCKWVPHFIEGDAAEKVVTQESSPELRQMIANFASKLTDADIRRIAEERGIIFTAVPIDTDPAQGESITIPQLASVGNSVVSDDLPNRYWSLVKIAKDEGAPVGGLKKIADLQAAIRTHRQQKAA